MEPKGFRDRILEKWRSIKDIAREASSKLLQLSELLAWFLLVCLIDEKERLGEEAKKKRPRSREEREKKLDEIIYKFRFHVALINSAMDDIEKKCKGSYLTNAVRRLFCIVFDERKVVLYRRLLSS